MREFSFVETYVKIFNHWIGLDEVTPIILTILNVIFAVVSPCLNISLCYVIFNKKRHRTTESFLASNLFMAGIIGGMVPLLVVVGFFCDSCVSSGRFRATIVIFTIAHGVYNFSSVVTIAVHRALNLNKVPSATPLSQCKQFLLTFPTLVFSVSSPFAASLVLHHSGKAFGISLVVGTAVAALVTAVSYGSILMRVHHSRNRVQHAGNNCNMYKRVLTNVNRIICVFVLTHSIILMRGALFLIHADNAKRWLVYLDVGVRTSQTVSAVLNPLVYLHSNPPVRKEVAAVFCRQKSYNRTTAVSPPDNR